MADANNVSTRNKQLGTNKGNEEVVMPKQSQNNSLIGDPLATNNTSNQRHQGQTDTQVGEMENFNNISQASDINNQVTRNINN